MVKCIRTGPLVEFGAAWKLFFGLLLSVSLQIGVSGQTVPRPDHVVICVLENHGYWSIVGSPYAPFINGLIGRSALLQEYYALTHPSQPNYIMLYSGDAQGVSDDYLPSGTPWSTPNLGSALLQNGFTFVGYSEDLPGQGALDEVSGGYYRKHSPWVNWQGTGTNQLPIACNQPFSAFPVDYHFLPDVSFVIPTVDHDMHDGTDPQRIQTGDDWVRDHLEAYIDWADQNNSLFILVFDEDDDLSQNHILCLFHGPMVQNGVYGTNGHHHYDLLRTLVDMYDLPDIGASAGAEPIDEIWQQATSTSFNSTPGSNFVLWPNPGMTTQGFEISSASGFRRGDVLIVRDGLSRELYRQTLDTDSKRLQVSSDALALQTGLFFVELWSGGSRLFTSKLVRH